MLDRVTSPVSLSECTAKRAVPRGLFGSLGYTDITVTP